MSPRWGLCSNPVLFNYQKVAPHGQFHLKKRFSNNLSEALCADFSNLGIAVQPRLL